MALALQDLLRERCQPAQAAFLRCCKKNSSIAAEADGPVGSV